MSIGLKRGLVKLEPHSKEWDESAREKIRLLRELLGEDARDIQHIGSTSIPAVLAKPIIDLVIGVDSYEKMHQHDEVLARHGILYRNQSDDG